MSTTIIPGLTFQRSSYPKVVNGYNTEVTESDYVIHISQMNKSESISSVVYDKLMKKIIYRKDNESWTWANIDDDSFKLMKYNRGKQGEEDWHSLEWKTDCQYTTFGSKTVTIPNEDMETHNNALQSALSLLSGS